MLGRRGQARGAGRADQLRSQNAVKSCRRSRGPSTPDSFGERSESCDGSPQPLAVESIAKTSAWRVELIIVHLFAFAFLLNAQRSRVSAGGRSRRQDRRGLRLGGRRPEMGWWLNRPDGLWFSGLFDEGPRRQRLQAKV